MKSYYMSSTPVLWYYFVCFQHYCTSYTWNGELRHTPYWLERDSGTKNVRTWLPCNSERPGTKHHRQSMEFRHHFVKKERRVTLFIVEVLSSTVSCEAWLTLACFYKSVTFLEKRIETEDVHFSTCTFSDLCWTVLLPWRSKQIWRLIFVCS